MSKIGKQNRNNFLIKLYDLMEKHNWWYDIFPIDSIEAETGHQEYLEIRRLSSKSKKSKNLFAAYNSYILGFEKKPKLEDYL